MPFVVPNLQAASGSRSGATWLNGTLTLVQSGGVSRLGNSIGAGQPGGLITITTSWGFMMGMAGRRVTTLAVNASGTTFERASSWTFGGYASATAEISTTIEEFSINFRTGQLSLVRAVTSAPTPIFNLTNWGLGYEIAHIRNSTAATLLVMPARPRNLYRFWINSVQTAGTSGGFTGLGLAVSNFNYDIGPVFFAFT
jgi:hypothetical protein